MKAGTYDLVYGTRAMVTSSYRLCCRCIDRGVRTKATHCVIHPWWAFKWSECVCEDCLKPNEKKQDPQP